MKPVKIFQVNVAGYVNPLQHMRGPNENVIEMARAKVRESIQALEVLLECKSAVRIPVDVCFDLIDIENGHVHKSIRLLNVLQGLPMILVQYIFMNKIMLMLIQCSDVCTI
jgi:hypothetical protein